MEMAGIIAIILILLFGEVFQTLETSFRHSMALVDELLSLAHPYTLANGMETKLAHVLICE